MSLGNQSSYKCEIIHYLMGVQEIHIKEGSNFKNKQTQINFSSNSYYILHLEVGIRICSMICIISIIVITITSQHAYYGGLTHT